MNAKTSKLVRRYADANGLPYRLAKRSYNHYPKRKRFAAKNEMRASIYAIHNKMKPADAKRAVVRVFGSCC